MPENDCFSLRKLETYEYPAEDLCPMCGGPYHNVAPEYEECPKCNLCGECCGRVNNCPGPLGEED